MARVINSSTDLKEWFFQQGKSNCGDESVKSGVFVGTKVRRDILLGHDQGRMIYKGRVMYIQFKNEGGGIYRSFLDPPTPDPSASTEEGE